jgi:hypothetical protein
MFLVGKIITRGWESFTKVSIFLSIILLELLKLNIFYTISGFPVELEYGKKYGMYFKFFVSYPCREAYRRDSSLNFCFFFNFI